MNLKERVTQIIRQEWGDHLASTEFKGPYEGEDLFVYVNLREEPADYDQREARMRDRVWDLGHDVGLVVDLVDDLVPA
ncbi:MAG: hypothetical protein COZ06_08445 [Armatimonadetes bacterium CG_4_10_14_3_um_filter_66_18]|nr:hypothetical protein [Armatimonadota bacterium]OIO92246.1 MAG: hypothetical protein AUJ96_32525 [Armatimonadetes bacterium CG2_30_66_41]PIY50608.1 MAG: hypothetical protein COZ06_08445 [Armatimonadetes bacterium CG_4_10_14_3_um_filter_66_18]